MAENGCKWLVSAGNARNGWNGYKCLEMAGNGWDGLKILDMAVNSCKLLEMTGNGWNCRICKKKKKRSKLRGFILVRTGFIPARTGFSRMGTGLIRVRTVFIGVRVKPVFTLMKPYQTQIRAKVGNFIFSCFIFCLTVCLLSASRERNTIRISTNKCFFLLLVI